MRRQAYGSLGLIGDNEEVSKESPHFAPARLTAFAQLTRWRRQMKYVDEQRLQEATRSQSNFHTDSRFHGQFVNNQGEGHSDEEVRDRPLKW